MTKEEQDVLDILSNRNYVVIYRRDLSLRRSKRLTLEEAQRLAKRETKKYKEYPHIWFLIKTVQPHYMTLGIWNRTDKEEVEADRRKWDFLKCPKKRTKKKL